VVPYGIPSAPKPARPTQNARITFLLLGSYERRKGQDIFLDAIAQLPADTRGRGIFQMAGRNLESDFYEAIASRAASLPNIQLIGGLEHDDALAAVKAADVLVCASRDETMPIAILEAMSLGKAIVATDVGGISEWLCNGEDALIVPPQNSSAFSRALRRCLDEPRLAETLGANARQTFLRSFSIDRLAETFAGLIQNVRRKS
jgi:glycosyltransferase involved in cell wall biosynthesis